MKISIKKIQFIFLFLYLFFLAFFNFTPFYLICAVMLILVTMIKICRKKIFTMTKYFYFELIFIGYNLMYVATGYSLNSEHTLDAIKTLCLNFVINMCILNTIENREDLLNVLRWFIPIAVFSNLYAIIYSHGTGVDGRLMHGLARPFSTTSYTSMEFASWAIYAGTIAIFFAINRSKKIYLCTFPLYWTIILWSGSRKWLVFGALLQCAVYLFCNQKINYRKFLKRLLIILLICVSAIWFIMNNSTLYNIIGYRIMGYIMGTETSAMSRNYLSQTAIMYIKKRPFFGYGLNTFRDVNKFNNWSEINYLELAFGGGIILAVIYYAFLVYVIYKLFKIRKNNKLNLLFMFIILMIITSDSMSMSYLQRLEQFFISVSVLNLMIDNKERKKNVSKNLCCDA